MVTNHHEKRTSCNSHPPSNQPGSGPPQRPFSTTAAVVDYDLLLGLPYAGAIWAPVFTSPKTIKDLTQPSKNNSGLGTIVICPEKK